MYAISELDGKFSVSIEGSPQLVLDATNRVDCDTEAENLVECKQNGERKILLTTLTASYLGFDIKVYWSLCGNCYTGSVNNGGAAQHFWGISWDDFMKYFQEAVMLVIEEGSA